MTTHNGQLFIDKFIEETLTLYDVVQDYSVINAAVLFGVISKQSKQDTSKNISGIYPGNIFAVDQLLERFYVFEQQFNLGVITQDIEYNINFWNSSKENNRTLTQVDETSPAGTSFVFGSIPQVFYPENEKVFTLYVYVDGPPFQHTIYNCYVLPTIFPIEIFGKRIEAINSRWLFDPDWKTTIDFSYVWLSVLENNNKFYEQRRPLYSLVQREQTATFIFEKQNAQKLYQDMLRFSKLVLSIPIYNELLTPVFPIISETTIEFHEDFTHYYNLRNLTRFCIFGVLDNDSKVEIKEIDSINTPSKEINFKYPVLENFPVGQTLVYPIFLGSVDDFRFESETDNLIKTRLKLMEEKFV